MTSPQPNAGDHRGEPLAPPQSSSRWDIARGVCPLLVGTVLAVIPAPPGLSLDGWRYFALFAAVVVGIITEPLPAAAIGILGIVVAAVLGLVRESPAEATAWALSGFANSTVWLVFAAYMFALGYSQTGLGKRIALHLIRVMGRRTLGLGYAIVLADLALAPFTPSSTARSGATIYPIVRQIPELYESRPNDDSARWIGAYLLYVAAAASCVTSSLFLTGMAPNALALTLAAQNADVRVSWLDWFIGFAPVGLVLLALLPLALFKFFPPGLTHVPKAPEWAEEQLGRMGRLTKREITLVGLVLLAIALWVGATRFIDPSLAALLIVALMVALRVVSWDDVVGNAAAWNVLLWFSTLLTLASGLAETGVVEWLAGSIAPKLSGLGDYGTLVGLVSTFFFLHYLFASITAHTAALFPVFFGVAVQTLPGSPTRSAMLLAYALGLMGILTSYGAGQIPIYYGSGYIRRRDFWALGFAVGSAFLLVYLAIIVPWLAWLEI